MSTINDCVEKLRAVIQEEIISSVREITPNCISLSTACKVFCLLIFVLCARNGVGSSTTALTTRSGSVGSFSKWTSLFLQSPNRTTGSKESHPWLQPHRSPREIAITTYTDSLSTRFINTVTDFRRSGLKGRTRAPVRVCSGVRRSAHSTLLLPARNLR